MIVTTPSDAIIYQDDKKIGVAPQTVLIAPDGTSTIRIERPGYAMKELKNVNGSKDRIDVNLVRDFGQAAPPVKPPTKPTGKGSAVAAPPPPPPPTQPTAPAKPPPPKGCPAGQKLIMGECVTM